MIVLSERACDARCMVYFYREKITMSDLFYHQPNLQALAGVYKSCILSTMSDQNTGKLNRLLAELGDTHLISSRWLRAHGYSNSLVARYVSSGWLVSPVRGVYMRKGGHLQWEGVVRSLQVGEGVPLHVGGRFALSLLGHERYLRLGDAGTITLYGPRRSPGCLGKLPLEQRFEFLGKGALDLLPLSFASEVPEKTLSEQGLTWHQAAPGTDALLCSTPERATLELCDGIAGATLVYEADALMQAMTTLRPQRVSLMLGTGDEDAGRYRRHRPEQTLLYRIVDEYYPAFTTHLTEQGRELPGYIQREFEDYLKCGRLEHGFLRVRCESCHAEYLAAFSCKRRGFCPSCGAQRMAESAALPTRSVRGNGVEPPHHVDATELNPTKIL
jgi:hypothetical protein